MSAADSLGLPIIGRLLGHSQPSTTARYAHLHADPLRRASDIISGQIAAAMGEAVGKNVLTESPHHQPPATEPRLYDA